LQCPDSLAAWRLRFCIVDNIVLKTKALKKLAYLAENLGPKGKVEFWVEDLVQTSTIV
jgi:hypothetical protein